MANEENNKMMMLLLLSMMSMISGEEQKEPLMQMAASVSGFNPMPPAMDKCTADNGAKLIHGIRGLADYLGISIPTAQRIKDSGRLDPAIQRIGRQFNFDMEKVNEILANDK